MVSPDARSLSDSSHSSTSGFLFGKFFQLYGAFHQFDTSGFFTFELTWAFGQLYGPQSIQEKEATTR